MGQDGPGGPVPREGFMMWCSRQASGPTACSGSRLLLPPVTSVFNPEDWSGSGTLGLAQHKLFPSYHCVGGSKRLPFSFSFQPALQRRYFWSFQLCTFDLDQEPYRWIWFCNGSSERNFLFIFSVLAGAIFSLSLMIFCLIPPPTCQGHGSNICMVLRGC